MKSPPPKSSTPPLSDGTADPPSATSSSSSSAPGPQNSANTSTVQPPSPSTMAAPSAAGVVSPFHGINFSSTRVPLPIDMLQPAFMFIVITVGYIVGIFDQEDQIDMVTLFLVPGYAVRQFFSWEEALAYYTERFNAGDVRIVQPIAPTATIRPAPNPTTSQAGATSTAASASSSSSPTSALPQPHSTTASASESSPNSINAPSSSKPRISTATSSAEAHDPTARFGTKPNPIPIGLGDTLTARAIHLSRHHNSPTRSTGSRMGTALGSPSRLASRGMRRLRIIKSKSTRNTTPQNDTRAGVLDSSDEEIRLVRRLDQQGRALCARGSAPLAARGGAPLAARGGAPPSYREAITHPGSSTSSVNPSPASGTQSSGSALSQPVPSSSQTASAAPTASVPPAVTLPDSQAAPPPVSWERPWPSRPTTPHPPYSFDDMAAGRSRFNREDEQLFEDIGTLIHRAWATPAAPNLWPTLSDEVAARRRRLLLALGQEMISSYPQDNQASGSSNANPTNSTEQASSSNIQVLNGLNSVNGAHEESEASSSAQSHVGSSASDGMDISGDGPGPDLN